MNKKIAIASLTVLMVLPLMSMAELRLPSSNPDFSVWTIVTAVLNLIWPIFIGFAIIMFIVAGFEFLTAQGEISKVVKARQAVIWASVGVVVGVLAFSLPFVIWNQLGV
ncbi:MAG: hypothetical protein A3A98_03785 [Candidatus Staskawiczbacteria bacterium RIFCSPLOWO2_01_FULL_40_39]|uniref:Uncharacterized protein n=1 Tax=Candidatus Staskawiczbacteria bacterium RIFCSPHIGHO2_01_FULL_39_25 TaxID=1802202 RepID=A0A1G2HQ99_9BACT|nr:MAG: hypothetical protein A2730_03000 [Candidatus Staskawiczbacteria bacterium RIFCSPHIGHO2_01_FULL_39_25]OGZ73531.1 MAG: hypothetical protein A3A98_03785 [Candidatus Staskawiczbacteria bacterium RIFCSPLOWO2_01_FULL_40_39]OGZ75418.1 MAG: hypothetical protein A3I87_03185 [Candidatus Staskawiczbacteria bacterium RIFCSPLOWO2_02_FULL_39_8]